MDLEDGIRTAATGGFCLARWKGATCGRRLRTERDMVLNDRGKRVPKVVYACRKHGRNIYDPLSK